MEKEQEEEEEFNDAVVSMGEERVHNATYSKLDHVYYAGGRAYRAKDPDYFSPGKLCENVNLQKFEIN